MIRSRAHSISALLICLTLAVSIGACRRLQSDEAAPQPRTEIERSPAHDSIESIHLPFGLSGGAQDRHLINGRGSVFSYNPERGTVDWIAWRTTRGDLGDSIPRPEFTTDSRLPSHVRRIGYYDYSGSGYDRGHMVPSADRFADPDMNRETFMMTNIVPQTEALNQFPWEKLESYVRSQVRRRAGFDVYQIAGVYGIREVIKGKLTAPTNCWKVVVFVPRGQAPEITERIRVLAVDMPNIDGIEAQPWQRYLTTVRSIEERTGLDLFSKLPRDLQNRVETRMEMNSIR
jgi:endonuclease G